MSDIELGPESAIPRSLIDRVVSDSSGSTSSTPTDAASVRAYASQRLLKLTPRALDSLEVAMDAGSMKERILAAQEVLKRSEATRDEQLVTSHQLPPAFAQLFVESLKSLAQYLPVQKDTPPAISIPAQDIEVTIEP